MSDETKITDLESPVVEEAPKARKAKAKIDLTDVPAVQEETAVEVVSKHGGAGLSGKKVDITIHTGEGELGKVPADVGINGYVYRIKRNERVTVPVEVVDILQRAMRKIYSSQGHGQPQTINNVPRFPMTIHGQLI